ncbi:MAG: transcription-repair coupling factor [Clostridia bacterium]
MENLSQIITNLKEYNELLSRITKKQTETLVCGVSHIHKANIIAAINTNFARQTVIVTANEGISKRMQEDIEAFTDEQVLMLHARDFVFHNIVSSSRNSTQSRIETLDKIQNFNGIIITTIDALLGATIPPDVLKNAKFSIENGETYDIAELTQKLINAGYVRRIQVEGVSQFSLRGGILDIFPVGSDLPVRIEFFDDEVDLMATFDLDSQRRKDNISSIEILPAIEVLPHFTEGGIDGLVSKLENFLQSKVKKSVELETNIKKDIEKLKNDGVFPTLDRYLTLIYPKIYTAADYLSKNALIFLDDSHTITEQATVYFKRNCEEMSSLIERGIIISQNVDYFLDFPAFYAKIRKTNVTMLDTFLQKNHFIDPKAIINVTAKQLPAYGGNIELALEDIKYYSENGYKVIILCKGDLRAKNMAEILKNFPVKITNDPKGKLSIVDASVSSGFEYPSIKLAVITEGQIIAKTNDKKVRKSNRQHVKSYTDLTVGDIVVHEKYGIGKFIGLEKMTFDKIERDYVTILYSAGDTVSVPTTNLDAISKYIGAGGEDSTVRLNKLGGADWKKTKARAKKAAKDLAKYLTELYAKRAKIEGISFEPDDVWQEDFENAFVFDETDDQLRSIDEIKSDMQKPIPMDRLLCGDVGFGKTEVALRAVMKCILSGKQAAILVPTTVLARQHYLTAMQRFNGFPIKIEFISRFKTPKEEKNILQRLKDGNIDLIIGTHKLFMKEIKFRDLGLLVIDEEQRFGVAHKEKLKELGAQIDVLTLSATPIPRTLNMALSGIRDMSVLEQAPHNRHPVETYVLEYDFGIIIDAIRREISRNGQCFYLHNRVDTINSVAFKIQMELPDINVEVAHGKMSQRQLSNIMAKMNDGEIDVLVATTIIETGIDVSNANTLIIENADQMGLSQLHQIRGRVGRSNRVAYAYLTYQAGKVLSDVASKRLAAIREFAEFGSGFKIAMRDLEIRGAGNVLGSEQSGHLNGVGYDLYLQLLEEAVLEENGIEKPKLTECVVDIPVSANIPTDYIGDIGQRIDLYRRIAMIKTEADRLDMVDEILDRYGEPPKNMLALCYIAKIRAIASINDISKISIKEGKLYFEYEKVNIERMMYLCSEFKDRMVLNFEEQPYIVLKLKPREDIVLLCNEIISKL